MSTLPPHAIMPPHLGPSEDPKRSPGLMGTGSTAALASGDLSDERGQASVLIVDEQPAIRVALEAGLHVPDQAAVLARSREEALRRLLNEDRALILLDIQRPGLSRIETAALLRGREKTRHIPIIFFPAHVDADLQEL